MKKLILTLSIAIASYFSYAQNNIFPTSGNVGIGTTSPSAKFHIQADANTSGSPDNAQFYITGSTSPGKRLSLAYNTSSNYGEIQSQAYSGSYSALNLNPDGGNVGIGTTNPYGKFQVKNSTSTYPFTLLTYDAGTSESKLAIARSSGQYFSNGFVASLAFQGDAIPNGAYDPVDKWGIRLYQIASGDSNTDLSFYDYTNLRSVLWLNRNGNVGIGTTSPSTTLDVSGVLRVENVSNAGQFSDIYTSGAVTFFDSNTNSTVYNGVQHIFKEANDEKMRISTSGNLLIGKTSQSDPTVRLDIAGKARANEIVVNSDGADFVFEPEYNLPKLSEVKSYIEQNQHLPEIPSAKEMKKAGMSVGEFNTKLLQKIEELTLYLIEKDKQVDTLQDDVIKLKKQIASIIKN